MKVVGILGGMGPLATQAFYGHLIRETDVRRDQDHLHVVVDANPAIPDRTAFLLSGGEDPRPALIASAKTLRSMGAEIGAIPCNTASRFSDDVSAASELEIVPWIATTADAIQRMHYRSVGLLATSGTVSARLYQDALESVDIEVLVPTSEDQASVMDVIYGAEGVKAQGSANAAGIASLLLVARHLVQSGADAVVLGCTELPLALAADSPSWPVPAVDPAVHVARRLIALAGAPVRALPALRPKNHPRSH